ncbi:hypothetical protein EON81_04540 [bacterium]|nr:MAG: hypothetical protein EON81_04540 [bacterium]
MLSEIRNSTIRDLSDKVKKQNYGQYLYSLRLNHVRMFNGARIDFHFPVTALIGPNGSGKSTVLGMCACAYSSIKPKDIFRKTRVYDEIMDNWSAEFDLVEKSLNPKGFSKVEVEFSKNVWHIQPKVSRHVAFLRITRTLPVADNPLFTHKKKMSIHDTQVHPTTLDYKEVENIEHIKLSASKILGKTLNDFKLIEIQFTTTKSKNPKLFYYTAEESHDEFGNLVEIRTRRQRTTEELEAIRSTKKIVSKQYVYVGKNNEGYYSEFQFGSGESSVIRAVAEIEALEKNSLLLIEEIENGLHPLAVLRLVEYLIDVANRKSIQVIFTTHSDYALGPLPSEAVWAALDGRLQQGKLPIEVLRAITGRVEVKLAVFVEDEFAKHWVESCLRYARFESFDEAKVYALAGDGNAVKIHEAHRKNPSIPFKSIAIVDGDSSQPDNSSFGIYRLPGASPELEVFNTVLENIEEVLAVLTVGCQLSPSRQADVESTVRSVSTTNYDPHLIFNQIGTKLGLVAESIVRGAFLNVWCDLKKGEAEVIAQAVENAIETADSGKE